MQRSQAHAITMTLTTTRSWHYLILGTSSIEDQNKEYNLASDHDIVFSSHSTKQQSICVCFAS